MSATTIPQDEAPAAEAGRGIGTALIRGFLKRALEDDAVVDEVNLMIFDHVVGGRYHPSDVATALPTYINEILDTAAPEDWQAVASELIAEASELEEPGRDEGERSEPTPGNEVIAPVGEPPLLRFIDHRRQRYAEKVPIAEAGEFIIGSYRDDGSLSEDGEFRVTLLALGSGRRWAMCPHLESFGEGTGALRRAIAAGLLDALAPVAGNDEFARRLLSIGILDGSDEPLPPACPDGARQARRR
jgi:hypothetical protein